MNPWLELGFAAICCFYLDHFHRRYGDSLDDRGGCISPALTMQRIIQGKAPYAWSPQPEWAKTAWPAWKSTPKSA